MKKHLSLWRFVSVVICGTQIQEISHENMLQNLGAFAYLKEHFASVIYNYTVLHIHILQLGNRNSIFLRDLSHFICVIVSTQTLVFIFKAINSTSLGNNLVLKRTKQFDCHLFDDLRICHVPTFSYIEIRSLYS